MNRELVIPGGGGNYPIQGDVTGTAGNANVVVTGIQNTPVQKTTLASGALLEYNQNINSWQAVLVATIQINGLTISTDPWMSVNKAKPITVNGS